ncbi:MAG: SDR family oxidoreductase [Planctomycetales bacterium]|nr:SDR family oxidoreductase [Planctomycetales bacterium]
MTSTPPIGRWNDKVVLVTGGSGGLGRSIARAFVQAGADVVITARGAEALERTADELRAEGGRVTPIAADITRDDDVERLFATIREHCGRLDVLVNNAGLSTRSRVIDTTPDDFRGLVELNLLALVRCTRAAYPLISQQRGHIVNIGSLAGKVGSRYMGAYPASKHAVTAYTQQLRLELADEGIHVMLVCPGPIARTDGGTRYVKEAEDLPDVASKPGGGAKVRQLDPDRLAAKIVRGCERRNAELVLPPRARLLFAIGQLSARAGDWLVRRFT